ncbi:MAG: MCP four helix bundle domain-containing protein, partial [Desulfobacteraceae bacterium]|nr:MCP four helix bundle domain-containing protein [Desulfobacteraceae bacterium]
MVGLISDHPPAFGNLYGKGERAMQWFYDMKVGKRLLVSFGVVLTLLMLVAGVGLWGLVASEHKVMAMLDTEGKLLQYATRLRANILGMRRGEKDIFLNVKDPGKVAEYYRESWSAQEKKADERFADLERVAIHADDKSDIKKIKENVQIYRDGFKKVYAMIGAGQIATPEEGNKAIMPYKDAIHIME